MKKTLMILGNFRDTRTISILSEAKKLGLRTVLCVNDNLDLKTGCSPDTVYFTDWNDPKALIAIARQEEIDGVVATGDPSVLGTAAVAEDLKLRGSSTKSVHDLMFKPSFRELQKSSGIFCPGFFSVDDLDEALSKVQNLNFPIIVKPVLSSSSHGQSVIWNYSAGQFTEAFENAAAVSRNGRVCVEEYIENTADHIIELDAFLMDGQFIFEGFRDSYRSEKCILRPVCDVYPAEISQEQRSEAEASTRNVLLASGASFGHFNVEGFFTKEGRFFVVEVNPRLPGCYNCDHIMLHSDVNMIRLLITTAVNDMNYFTELKTFRRENRLILSHSLFGNKSGIFNGLYIDKELESRVRHCAFSESNIWPYVQDIFHADHSLAKLAYEFDDKSQLEQARKNLDELIYPIVMSL